MITLFTKLHLFSQFGYSDVIAFFFNFPILLYDHPLISSVVMHMSYLPVLLSWCPNPLSYILSSIWISDSIYGGLDLNEGDQVAVTDPSYPTYKMFAYIILSIISE